MHFMLRQFGVLFLVLFIITPSNGWRRRRRNPPLPGCSSDPPRVDHGKLSTNGRNHGSTATFKCDANYKFGTGDSTRTCNSGSWTGRQPTCVLACVNLRTPLNGGVQVSETSALYSCKSGFRLVGANRRYCIGTVWSGTAPVCERLCHTALSNPSYGLVTVSNNRATYSCFTHYKIVGAAIRLCSNGAWVGAPPRCVLECGSVDNPANGRVTVTGNRAHYECNSKYRLKGNTVRTCQNRKWTGTTPVCSKVCSTALDTPDHGSVRVSVDTATYSCFTNYKIEGTATRRCSNGEWLGDTPTCVLECRSLDNPANGRVTVSGNTAQYECNSGYRLKGVTVRTCVNKQWTGTTSICSKVCSTALDTPDHGSVRVSDDTATYSCFTNYKIEGTAIRHCSNGEWLGDTPTCRLACRNLENPANGKISIAGYTAHYQCFPKYGIEGDIVRTCQNNTWTGSAPVCTKRCEDFAPPDNGYVSFDGQKATFACRSRYQLIGNKDTVCVNGQWSKSAPTCVLECGMPFRPMNGTVTLQGATAYFECSTGYKLLGDYVRDCDDGAWSGSQPRCLKDCPNLRHPDNGFVTISGRTATFACFPNYNLLGHKQISCTSQGKWTGTKPRCVLSCPLRSPRNGNCILHGILVVNTCNQGFRLVGDTIRFCNSGIWSGKPAICLKSDIIITSSSD